MAKQTGSTNKITEAARTLGSIGGKKGGPARAKILPASRRKAIARKGGKAAARKR